MDREKAAVNIEELAERLNKQAKAITALRKRVSALEASTAGATSSTVPEPAAQADLPASFQYTGTPGAYVPNRLCVACGSVKEFGRKELTCKRCGAERNRIIVNKLQPRPAYAVCGNCGESKAADMRLLCTPCSKSFKAWKAEQ
jgi:hypothetical protein